MRSGRIYGPCERFFRHTNDAAGYRAALALRRAGNENESDGTLWIFPPLPWTNNALDSDARRASKITE